jgi:hypothetical protein
MGELFTSRRCMLFLCYLFLVSLVVKWNNDSRQLVVVSRVFARECISEKRESLIKP